MKNFYNELPEDFKGTHRKTLSLEYLFKVDENALALSAIKAE